MTNKENEIKYGRYMEEECCEECNYAGGSMRHSPPVPISICPECGGKLESVIGRWKYTEEPTGGFLGLFGDTKTTYHGFEKGREGQQGKTVQESFLHRNEEVAKWLDECSPYKDGAGFVKGEMPDIRICWEPAEEIAEEKQAETSALVNLIRWHNIEKDGYPPEAGIEYDVYTHDAGYTKVVKVITYDGGNYSPIWLNDNGAEWIFPITHWRERPAPPRVGT